MAQMPSGEVLTREMTEALPLYCYVDRNTSDSLAKQDMQIDENTRLEISSVHYFGEAGGIMCCVDVTNGERPLIMSATSFEFHDKGEIYNKINEYRKARIKWLREQEERDRLLGKGKQMNIVEFSGQGANQVIKFSDEDRDTEMLVFPNRKAHRNVKPKIPENVTSKIPGNSFCPCGSGKKYKKCCGTITNGRS